MSAGRNENVALGNSRGSASRSAAMYSSLGPWSSLSEIRMSASAGPIGAELE